MSDGRKPTNLTLDSTLVAQARAQQVNLSRAAEAGIRAALSQSQAALWQAENAAAIDSSNAFVEAEGLPLSGFRPF
ncbi:MAG: type II toxin-antitoxin system CcdA family antitoxin [Maritimibacter sp.]